MQIEILRMMIQNIEQFMVIAYIYQVLPLLNTFGYLKKDYIIIEGTGDNFCNEEYGKLNKKAFKYAEKYNKYLIKH